MVGIAQLVEHLVVVQDVAGSNPVSRPTFPLIVNIAEYMRILYLGNSQGFDRASKYYFTPQKLINGFTRLGHNVYAFNDRDFARYSNIFRSQKMGQDKMNEEVKKIARDYQPELVVLGHCKNISNETLQAVKEISPGCRILYRNVDPVHEPKNIGDIQQRSGVVDAIFITTAGEPLKQFHNDKTLVTFMPNPVDPAVENKKAFENKNADIDFIFLASYLRHQEDLRHVTAKYLLENEGDLNIWIGGAGINDNKVFGSAYYDLLERSKMGLCMNKTADHYLYASGRMSQYMASGVLAFIPEGPQFEDVLGNDSFISYKTNEELLDKVKYYAANDAERITIARTGYEKVHDLFHVDKVCQYMIERTFDKKLSQDYGWPVDIY